MPARTRCRAQESVEGNPQLYPVGGIMPHVAARATQAGGLSCGVSGIGALSGPLAKYNARLPWPVPAWGVCSCPALVNMAKPSAKKTDTGEVEPLPQTYEEALDELDELVARMEAGALPLEQLLAAYQRGAHLLTFCRGRLDAIESQVKVLEEGQIKPWDDA
jgi:exodeoxyribonuclease VII small subunit